MNTRIVRVLKSPRFQILLNISRPETGIYAGSEYIRGNEPTEFTVRVISHPLTRLALPTTFPYEQTHVLPEGDRTEGSLIVYSFTKLQVKTDQQPGDRIMDHLGEDWEVMSCERWDDYGFYVVIASMLPRTINE